MEHKAKTLAFTVLQPIATEKPVEAVDARDIDLVYLTEQASKNDVSDEDLEALGKEIEHRAFVDGLFGQDFLADEGVNAPEFVNDYDCLRLMLGGVEEMCGEWSAYSLKYVGKVVTVCETKTAEEIA